MPVAALPIRAARAPWRGLIATVLVSNAFIMCLELVASRLVAQYLGQSLITWTSIIGIFLGGMAIGQYLGGRWAERYAPRKLLSLLFFASGLLTLCILPLNNFLGNWEFMREMAWTPRVLIHITATFTIPALFLGTINPVAARFALDAGLGPGLTVGQIYAAAALGSIAGVLVTGLYVIALFGTTAIVCGVAWMLLAFGYLYALAAFFAEGPIARELRRRKAILPETAPAEHERIAQGNLFPYAFTAFIVGAAFMIVELSASRMASRYLGQSLSFWTSLLSVMLAGITVGNFIGGRLADAKPTRTRLANLLVIAAASCLIVPPLNTWLGNGDFLHGAVWVFRILVHMSLAFFLPAMCIGMLGPVIARLALDTGRPRGNTLGAIYAWNSLGSVLGVFATGYLLIDWLWPAGVVCTLALGLVLTARLHRPRSMMLHGFTLIAVGAACVSLSPAQWTKTVGNALGLREYEPRGAIYRDHSKYGWITVVNYPAERLQLSFQIDALIHSVIEPADPLKLHYDYTWIYEAVVDEVLPGDDPIRTFFIGGGGFVMPRFYERTRPGSYLEVAEIDPAVTRAAHEAFGLAKDTTVSVHHMDARNRVADLVRSRQSGQAGEPFDVVFGDSFNQYSIPFALTTLEFNNALDEIMAEDGVYLLNLIDDPFKGWFLGSMIATCRQTWPHVYVFTCQKRESTSRDTYVLVASKRPLDLAHIPNKIRDTYVYLGYLLEDEEMDDYVRKAKGRILTDDYAPVDNLLRYLDLEPHS